MTSLHRRRVGGLRTLARGLAAIGLWGGIGHAALAQVRSIERLPTPWIEEGQPIELALVVMRPPGEGPFPTLIFHHGSVGNGNDPAEVTHTATYPALADFFNQRGWMVMFPQRRGRGGSTGRYAEGWDVEAGHYTCDPERSLAGLAHGLQDLDQVLQQVVARTDVDATRLLVGGHSHGGALAIAHAARHPAQFRAVLNFVGGWVGQRCPTVDAINGSVLGSAPPFAGPTLWLHGERDPTYRAGHARLMFERFVAAGGRGSFHQRSLNGGSNDHQLVRRRDVWAPLVETFVEALR